MRKLLLAAATFAAAVTAPPAAPAADDLPAVVLFVRPIGSILEDARAGAGVLGGPPLIKQFDAALKDTLGEKGFDGIDLTRPVVGYPLLAGKGKDDKLDDTPFVIAVPVSSERAFLDLVARANKGKGKAEPVAGKAGLYKLPAPQPVGKKDDAKPTGPSVMRFHGNCAYVTQEANAAALDPAVLVPAEKLYMPDETALLAVRVYFERLPTDVRLNLVDQIEKAVKELKNAPVPMNLKDRTKEINEELEKQLRSMLGRRLEELKDAREATFRTVFDPKSGEAAFELALGAKAGSGLAKDIAGRVPATNRFAGLVGTSAAAGLVLSGPAMAPEVRDLFAQGFEKGFNEGMANSPPPEFLNPLLKEVVAGAVRTIKAGELDAAVAVTGPDADGLFTAVAAVSFGDAAKVDAEVQKLLKEQAPPDIRDLVTVNAAKAGGVNIHRIKGPDGAVPPEVQKVFGASPAAAVGFGPKGIYLAVGPDPVAALKAAAVLKPAEARAVDLSLNAARLGKLAETVGGPAVAKQVADVLGDKDGLFSALFLSVDGGAEIKVRVGVNMKLAAGVAQSQMQGSPPAAKP